MEVPLQPVAPATAAYTVLSDTRIADGTAQTECGHYPSDNNDTAAKKEGQVSSRNAAKVSLMISEPTNR